MFIQTVSWCGVVIKWESNKVCIVQYNQKLARSVTLRSISIQVLVHIGQFFMGFICISKCNSLTQF